jgi:hypothetical protein
MGNLDGRFAAQWGMNQARGAPGSAPANRKQLRTPLSRAGRPALRFLEDGLCYRATRGAGSAGFADGIPGLCKRLASAGAT